LWEEAKRKGRGRCFGNLSHYIPLEGIPYKVIIRNQDRGVIINERRQSTGALMTLQKVLYATMKKRNEYRPSPTKREREESKSKSGNEIRTGLRIPP
jgi:hypothetical protein